MQTYCWKAFHVENTQTVENADSAMAGLEKAVTDVVFLHGSCELILIILLQVACVSDGANGLFVGIKSTESDSTPLPVAHALVWWRRIGSL